MYDVTLKLPPIIEILKSYAGLKSELIRKAYLVPLEVRRLTVPAPPLKHSHPFLSRPGANVSYIK